MSSNEPKLPFIEKGRYLHTKSGNVYEVLGIAVHSEDDTPMVVYKPLYDTSFEYCVRPYESFMELVNFDGVMKSRFEKITG